MSLISMYWNLDYIVETARRTMEAAFELEMVEMEPATPPSTPQPSSGTSPNADPIADLMSKLPMDPRAQLSGSSLIGTPPPAPVAAQPKPSVEPPLAATEQVKPKSPWTPEIEAALREFLRPLSVDMCSQYSFPDAVSENLSVALMRRTLQPQLRQNNTEDDTIRSENDNRRQMDRAQKTKDLRNAWTKTRV